jgi:hypothetical protein
VAPCQDILEQREKQMVCLIPTPVIAVSPEERFFLLLEKLSKVFT